MTARPRKQLIVDEELKPQTSALPPGAVQEYRQMIRLELIDFSPRNPRKDFDEDAMAELEADVRRFGILQAVGLRPNGARYELIWGERRCRAAKRAGLEEVPARVLDVDDRTAD